MSAHNMPSTALATPGQIATGINPKIKQIVWVASATQHSLISMGSFSTALISRRFLGINLGKIFVIILLKSGHFVFHFFMAIFSYILPSFSHFQPLKYALSGLIHFLGKILPIMKTSNPLQSIIIALYNQSIRIILSLLFLFYYKFIK